MLINQQRAIISPQRSRSIKVRVPNSKILPSDFFRRSSSHSPPKKANPSDIFVKKGLMQPQIKAKRYWDSMREQIEQNSPPNVKKQKPRIRLSAQSEKRTNKKSEQSPRKRESTKKISLIENKQTKASASHQVWEQGLFTFSSHGTNNKFLQIHLPPIK